MSEDEQDRQIASEWRRERELTRTLACLEAKADRYSRSLSVALAAIQPYAGAARKLNETGVVQVPKLDNPAGGDVAGLIREIEENEWDLANVRRRLDAMR